MIQVRRFLGSLSKRWVIQCMYCLSEKGTAQERESTRIGCKVEETLMKEIEELKKRIQKEQDNFSGVIVFIIVLILGFLGVRMFTDFDGGGEITPLALGFVVFGLALQIKRVLRCQSELLKILSEKS